MRVLTPELLRAFPGRVVNIHPSLIPAFPGMNAVGQALEPTASKSPGCTVHFVDEGVDTGPIIAQRAVEVLDTDRPITRSPGRAHPRRVEHPAARGRLAGESIASQASFAAEQQRRSARSPSQDELALLRRRRARALARQPRLGRRAALAPRFSRAARARPRASAPLTYRFDGRVLGRRSFSLLFGATPVWRRILHELAQSPPFRRRAAARGSDVRRARRSHAARRRCRRTSSSSPASSSASFPKCARSSTSFTRRSRA